MVRVDLEAPDGHGVVDADVPRGMHGQVSVDWHVADAALLLGEEHFLTPVRSENGRLETAIILLVDKGVRSLLAEDARVLDALLLDRTKQQGLIITPKGEPEVTVDDLELAQFVYLLLHNEKIRRVIDTITSKVVLILGRFTEERKAVLDAIRGALRKGTYVPILFDFAVPAGRDVTETVSLLARMARFIIADLTDPSSIPKELEAIVPQVAVPVQPLLEGASRPYAMFTDYWKYEWVLPVYRYEGLDQLLAGRWQGRRCL